jgi:hypothetical protein
LKISFVIISNTKISNTEYLIKEKNSEKMAFELKTSSSSSKKADLSTPSICIPRVFSNITKERVWNVFKELNLGHIERIDMVNKENDKGEKFKRVFVHLKYWNSSDESQETRKRLMDGEKVKIVYDEPWFWLISKSNVEKPNFQKNAQKKHPIEKKKDYSKPRRMTPMVEEKDTTRDELEQLKKIVEEQRIQLDMLRCQLDNKPTLERELKHPPKLDMEDLRSSPVPKGNGELPLEEDMNWASECEDEEEDYRPPSPTSPPPQAKRRVSVNAPKKVMMKKTYKEAMKPKKLDLKKDPTQGKVVDYSDI